jgi:hypothetical protein
MRKKNLFTTAIICLFIHWGYAQRPEAIRTYINEYKDLAVQEMIRTGVPAAIKIAQGIHETDAGNSILVKKSNNHFGIKCKTGWAGQSVKHTDDAYNECFRKYNTATDSYVDHSNFLKGSQRYASLFNLEPTDYQGWAYGLKKAGYATNPKYAQVLIRIIEEFQLQDYTLIAMGKTPLKEEGLAIVQMETGLSEIETGQSKKEPVFADLKTSGPKRPEPAQLKKIVEQAPLYPQGEFKINETRVVYAAKGTPYLAIAQQYNIPLFRLFEFNELPESEVTDKGMLIYIQRKRKTGNNDFHVIKPGESLHDIAQEQAIRFETLLEYNMLTKEMLPAPGEKLYLRQMAPARPKLALKDSYTLSKYQGDANY